MFLFRRVETSMTTASNVRNDETFRTFAIRSRDRSSERRLRIKTHAFTRLERHTETVTSRQSANTSEVVEVVVAANAEVPRESPRLENLRVFFASQDAPRGDSRWV